MKSLFISVLGSLRKSMRESIVTTKLVTTMQIIFLQCSQERKKLGLNLRHKIFTSEDGGRVPFFSCPQLCFKGSQNGEKYTLSTMVQQFVSLLS